MVKEFVKELIIDMPGYSFYNKRIFIIYLFKGNESLEDEDIMNFSSIMKYFHKVELLKIDLY